MLKGVSCNSMPDIVPVAYGTTLHEDDRMLAILPGDGRRQPGHKLRPSLAGNLLKALGREMVTLIHNQVAIIAHEIVDETASDRKSTRLNSSHTVISYAVFCLKKKKINNRNKLY